MVKKRPLVTFGREISRRRHALKLTLEALAERASLTSNYISTIENGQRDPSLSTIKSIARGLDVAPGELLGTLPGLSPQAVEMAKLFEQVAGDVQSSVLMMLRGVMTACSVFPR